MRNAGGKFLFEFVFFVFVFVVFVVFVVFAFFCCRPL